ncbi:MAG: hypothetical protein JSW71_05280 [Gemmatimonadota bacterium]|nr:MAG: hypothetical protein JSW71_05280 [Gemmatimonadota bacterium]
MRTRQLGPADWGALRGDERIVVVTRSGVRHELSEFQFYTTALVGQGERDEIEIPLDSIAVVEVRERNTATPIIFAALAVGTGVAVLIAQQQSPEEPASCPFVYSFDGEEYRFDSETFAGAVARGLDRTDYDNLEHLQPVGGRYRLRLVNSRPETQYTDELKLIVVDHAPGTRAIPDRSGQVHVTSDLRAPRTAWGVHGGEALAAVWHADDIYWSGAPLEEADLDKPGQLRDGLVVSFARPPGVQSATIVVRARNTALAPFALEEFLQLQGEGLFGWYLRVAEDEDLRERIRGWVAREGMLHILLWQEGRWTLQDALLDVGPALSKSQVARLDLGSVDTDTVVVRLASARGLWQIDWVALDAGPEKPLAVTEIVPLWARDERGRDVRELLASEDGRYYASVDGGVAEIEFAVPRLPSGDMARSVILKSRGFYYIHVPHGGPSQSALADRILDEPLVGNRYILERWRTMRR